MNYTVFLFLFLFSSCSKKDLRRIDFCEISNSMYYEMKEELPSLKKPLLFNKVQKINDSTVINYLLSNSHKFTKYSIKEYFNNSSSNVNYDLNCQTIDSKKFEKIQKELPMSNFWKKYNTIYGESDFIIFYEPIFNEQKTEFILYYKYFKYGLGDTSRLELYENTDGGTKLKKVLLTSTF